MRERWLAGLGVLALLAASCGGPGPSASVAPGASVQPAANECTPVAMVGPSGSSVRLTGNWRANDLGTYDIHQRGSCFYWLGMSQDAGSEPGEYWTNVFEGTVRGDFTIVGRWGDVPFNPTLNSDALGFGVMTLRIDFDASGGAERPVLRMVEESSGAFGGSIWIQEESLPAPTDLEGPFGGIEGEGCLWVEADGQRVELVGGGEWFYRDAPLSIQDLLGHIVARVGDPIRVRGQMAPLLGSGCADTAILVWELNPIP